MTGRTALGKISGAALQATELREMVAYRDLAARERALADLEQERARKAREDWTHAAFHDSAVEALRREAEHEQAAKQHLEAAEHYLRLASETGEP